MSAQDAPPRRPAKRNTSTAIRSSKPRDPAIERALQLSTFESNYSTEEFIGTLSEKLIAESKANPGRTCKVSVEKDRATDQGRSFQSHAVLADVFAGFGYIT